MTEQKIFSGLGADKDAKSEPSADRRSTMKPDLKGFPDPFDSAAPNLSQTQVDKRESELARSFKTNVEDILIALRLYQIGISYDTDKMREEAAALKGQYMYLRDVVFVTFPESTNPLWLKVLNAMGISNIASPGGIDWEQQVGA